MIPLLLLFLLSPLMAFATPIVLDTSTETIQTGQHTTGCITCTDYDTITTTTYGDYRQITNGAPPANRPEPPGQPGRFVTCPPDCYEWTGGAMLTRVEDTLTTFTETTHVPFTVISEDCPEPPGTPIPEPGTMWLFATGLLLLGVAKRNQL